MSAWLAIQDAVNHVNTSATVNLAGVLLEVVKRKLRILANLDQVAVRIAHVATPFPTMVVERLSKKDRAFCRAIACNRPRCPRHVD
jgi:hypothetical protein